MTLIYITCRDKKEARKVSKHLLIRRLIACVNIHPIDSMYWWKGKLVDEKEYVIIAKTKNSHVLAIRKEVKKVHSYKIPAIINFESGANEEYEKWVNAELTSNK